MNVTGLLILVFYTILGAAFLQKGSSFDLARHGIEFSRETVTAGLLYYFMIAIYLLAHNRRGFVVIDSYNIFVLFFSVLIAPGVIAAGAINGSYVPHYAMLFSGIIFLVMGIAFEMLSPGTTVRSMAVKFPHRISNRPAFIYFFMYFICVITVTISDNMNRAGVFSVIQDFLLSSSSVEYNAVAEYRSQVYHESSNLLSVIGNYAGGVFGVFFALILHAHLYRNDGFTSKLVATAIISFPIIFALGTGSRLLLLRTLFIYFVFFMLPYGLRLLDKRVLSGIALAFAVLIVSTSLLGRGIQGETGAENMVIQTEKAIKRLFLVKGTGSMWVYEYYPKVEPFEGGIPIIERASGIEIDGEPAIANKIFSYRYKGALGTAGPQTFGDFYASFGYLGQFLFTPLLAIALLSLRMLYRETSEKSTLDRAFWSFLIVSIGYTGYSDFGSFKAIGFIYVLILYLILRFIATTIGRPVTKRLNMKGGNA